MIPKSVHWELLILDGEPPSVDLGSAAAGDIDGDGQVEIVVGGAAGLWWYRPATMERGQIATGSYCVGLALEDIDGDGLPEIFSSARADGAGMIRAFKRPDRAGQPWRAFDVDPALPAPPHDMTFVDIDADGQRELLSNCTGKNAALFLYKPPKDLCQPWKRFTIWDGTFQEGLAVADLDGDGRLEIIHGPDVFFCPAGGPYAGPWTRRTYAPGFREMVRVSAADITGTGRPDIIVAESEYLDGRMSWFENRLVESPDRPWIEHPLEGPVYYAHSLQSVRQSDGAVRVFVAEMAEGGWKAPRNRDARLMELITRNGGATWEKHVLYRGAGTHQAFPMDVDGDGVDEIVGKQWRPPKVHLFKRRSEASPILSYRHRIIDRDKPTAATDIGAVDLDGTGRPYVFCGQWLYRCGDWARFEVPGYELLNAFDVDGDGRGELIAARRRPNPDRWILGLSSELVWLKPIDVAAGKWREFPIGTGDGDWPHGTAVGPIGPEGRLALLAGYHSAGKHGHRPEMFIAPSDPAGGPWERRVLADIDYGEEMLICDVNGDGRLDVIAGPWWLENAGDGAFVPHRMIENVKVARVAAFDVDGDGRPDVILGEEVLGRESRVVPRSRLAWLEQPKDPRDLWTPHIIDTIRCPHSIGVADLDGDGRMEVVAGEHDPYYPYRSRCRLLVYKQADPAGRAWWRHVLDDRFEHHDGCRIVQLQPGRLGILSHGWTDSRYVHLWTRD